MCNRRPSGSLEERGIEPARRRYGAVDNTLVMRWGGGDNGKTGGKSGKKWSALSGSGAERTPRLTRVTFPFITENCSGDVVSQVA